MILNVPTATPANRKIEGRYFAAGVASVGFGPVSDAGEPTSHRSWPAAATAIAPATGRPPCGSGSPTATGDVPLYDSLSVAMTLQAPR